MQESEGAVKFVNRLQIALEVPSTSSASQRPGLAQTYGSFESFSRVVTTDVEDTRVGKQK